MPLIYFNGIIFTLECSKYFQLLSNVFVSIESNRKRQKMQKRCDVLLLLFIS